MTNLQYARWLRSLVEYAEDDWMPMTSVVSTAARLTRTGASFEQLVTAMVKFLGERNQLDPNPRRQ